MPPGQAGDRFAKEGHHTANLDVDAGHAAADQCLQVGDDDDDDDVDAQDADGDDDADDGDGDEGG